MMKTKFLKNYKWPSNQTIIILRLENPMFLGRIFKKEMIDLITESKTFKFIDKHDFN